VIAKNLFAVAVAFYRAMDPAAVLILVNVALKNKLVKKQVVPDPGRDEVVVNSRNLKVSRLAFRVLALSA